MREFILSALVVLLTATVVIGGPQYPFPVSKGGTGAKTFTQGSVLFMGATAFSQSNSSLFWDSGNSRLGVGTASPTVPLDVNGNVLLRSNTQFGSSGASLSKVTSNSVVELGVDKPIFINSATSGIAIKDYSPNTIGVVFPGTSSIYPVTVSGGSATNGKMTISGTGSTGSSTFASDDGATYVSNVNPGIQTISFGVTLDGTISCSCTSAVGATAFTCGYSSLTSTGVSFSLYNATPALVNGAYSFTCRGQRHTGT